MNLNISSSSEDWRARALSNYAITPFYLLRPDDSRLYCRSVEGFWQGLKWPQSSVARTRTFALAGAEAKLSGEQAPRSTVIEWFGARMRVNSVEHRALAELAIRAKLEQNELVQRALAASSDLTFTHTVIGVDGRPLPDSVTLPARVFCNIWTRLRQELRD